MIFCNNHATTINSCMSSISADNFTKMPEHFANLTPDIAQVHRYFISVEITAQMMRPGISHNMCCHTKLLC